MGGYLIHAWRARWRALLVLALMVALAGAGAFAAIAGARRSATALERFHDAGQTLDVFVAADVVNEEPAALRELLDGPLVEKTNDLVFLFVDIGNDGVMFAPTSRRGIEVEQGVLIDGRRANPDEPSELVVSEAGAAQLGVDIGDIIEGASYSPEDAAALFSGAPPEVPGGPSLKFTVVGINRNGFDLSAAADSSTLTLTTPAFWEKYGDQIGIGSRSHMVRLVDDPGALEQFTDAVTDAYGEEHLPSINVGQGEENVVDAMSIVTVALFAAGLAVAVAGGAWVASAVVRQQRVLAADAQVLRALGATSRDRQLVFAGAVAPGLVLGALLAPIGAYALSPLLPVGISRHVDPREGFHADLVVLVGGAVVALVLGALIAVVSGWRLARAGRTAEPGLLRTSKIVGASARTLRPAPATGVRFALHVSRRASTPVRPALTGALVAVVGLVAVAVVGSSLDRLVDAPERWGTPWDVAVSARMFTDDPEAELSNSLPLNHDRVLAIDDAEATAELLYDEQVTVNGVEAISMALDSLRGDIEPTIVEGRAPRGDDEIALGRDTLDDSGASIGDSVEVMSRSQERAKLTVVGVLAFPVIGEGSPVATGAALTGATATRLRMGDPELSDDSGSRYAVIRWKAGVDQDAALAKLKVGPEEIGRTIDVIAALPTAPPEVDGLADVRRIPMLLAAALAVLGVIAIAHSLVVTVRRRRVELGVLSALGFAPGQRRLVVVVQATTIAVVALIVGIPLGAVLGRVVWSAIATSIGLATDASFPLALIAFGALALVVVLNLIAVWPAHTALRLRVADALRAE